jgi:ATP/maltotriose-dependent transcriptional regulator MalT
MSTPILYRRRLVNAIENSNKRLIYVYGPAGYGKTLVVRQWADEHEKPLVWFEGFATSSVSELITAMIYAIKNAIPELNEKLTNLIVPHEIDEGFISHFYSIISKNRQGFNFVVENAEIIRKSHNEIARKLILDLPVNVSLVVIFSAVPKSSFTRELGLERFTVISPTDLEFTDEEFKQLARQVSPKITESEIEDIFTLTGGWPAGVHLALTELETSSNPREVVSLIRNSGKKKFATIANRILALLSDEQQSLLSRLSLLPIIDSSAAFAVTDDDDAMRKLTVISQETVVLRQVSYDPPSFILNPILRSFLIENLQSDSDFQSKSEKVLEYLISSGDVRNAAKVLLELGSVKRLASFLKEESVTRTIDASIQDSILRSAVQEIRDWIPVSKWISEYGDIAREILSFYAEILSGNFTLADSHLSSLQDVLSETDKAFAELWSVDVLAMKTISLYSRGRLQEAFDLAMQAFGKSQEMQTIRRHHHVTYLQIALWSSVICDDDENIRRIQSILESDFMKDSLKNRNSMTQSMHALIAAHQGRIAEAKNLVVGPISRTTHEYFGGFFGNYGVKMAESLVLTESGDIQGSLKILDTALEAANRSRNFPMAIALLGRISYLQYLSVGPETALKSISEARAMINDNLLSEELHFSVDVWEARVRHLTNDHARTQELIKRSNQTYLMRAFSAAIQIIENPKKALELIETFDLSYPKQELTYHLFRAHIFSDNPSSQLAEVRKAVEVGSKHGYFNHFLTQRSDVIQQYISLAAEFPTAFNERLARAAGERLNEMIIGGQNSGDSLTRREADILRHLATGLPLKDIASNLNISKNTIKTHLRNLYKKLGAEDRKDAVEKGKKLLKV